MLRRTSMLLLCLGALALFTTGSYAQVDDGGFVVDSMDDLNETDLSMLNEGSEFDTGPSSGPFSNKPGWPNLDGSGQSGNPPAPTTDALAPASTAPAPVTTAPPTAAPSDTGTTVAMTPAPTPSMVPAPANKPDAYPTTTPATTTNKPTPAPTGQLDSSNSKCPMDSVIVSVEGKGSYCVFTTLGLICSGADAKGKCPGKQSGLEQGSHCGLVKSGVHGCVLGAGPKRCDLDEDDV